LRVFILGSEGFIGSNLVKYFTSLGAIVDGCDLTEYSTPGYAYHKHSILSPGFDELFAKKNFDACINASGNGNVGFSMLHPLSDFEANTYAVAKTLDCLRRYQPGCRFIHLSSAAVYGNPTKLPVKETDVTEPVSAYGFNKLMSEQLCGEYHRLYDIPVCILRPFSVYGSGLKKQLFWDICNKLLTAPTIELFGTGNESRDFLHINDLVHLTGLLLEKADFNMGIYNAASGNETSVRKVADLVEKFFGDGNKINFNGQQKTGDPLNWQADISKTVSLGFTNNTSLPDGIELYVKWFHTYASNR
jgi:UDP-glucose 4-epimerase